MVWRNVISTSGASLYLARPFHPESNMSADAQVPQQRARG